MIIPIDNNDYGDGAHLTIFMELDGAHAVVTSIPFTDVLKQITPVGFPVPQDYEQFEVALHSPHVKLNCTVITFKCASMTQIMSPGSPYRERAKS